MQFLEVFPINVGALRAVRHFDIFDIMLLTFVNSTEHITKSGAIDEPAVLVDKIAMTQGQFTTCMGVEKEGLTQRLQAICNGVPEAIQGSHLHISNSGLR
jgi:hypothetical protein